MIHPRSILLIFGSWIPIHPVHRPTIPRHRIIPEVVEIRQAAAAQIVINGRIL